LLRQRLLQQLPLPLHVAPVGPLQLPACMPAVQQTSVPEHVTHVTPLLPHSRFVLPAWQMLFEQQPEQEPPAPQTQVPFEQPVPVGQVTHVAPPVPQA
jgi:hypothetical protein